MIRSLSIAVVCAALSFLFALPATSSTSTNGCEATSAVLVSGKWALTCGAGGQCGVGGCDVSMSRDSDGNFQSCRCRDGALTRCCQLVRRPSTDKLDTLGDCASCGSTGSCYVVHKGEIATTSCLPVESHQ